MKTIADHETGKRKPDDSPLADFRSALEAGGVAFFDRNGKGPAVRLRHRAEDS